MKISYDFNLEGAWGSQAWQTAEILKAIPTCVDRPQARSRSKPRVSAQFNCCGGASRGKTGETHCSRRGRASKLRPRDAGGD